MLDAILNFLTYALITIEIVGIIGGVLFFVLAAEYMQANEKKGDGHEQQTSA